MGWTLLLLVFMSTGSSEPGETRRYSVSADGRTVGTYSQIIRYDKESNEYTVTTASDVHVKIFVVKYDYTFRSTELWAFGFLQTLKGEAVENGVLRASVADVNNKHDWTSSYWRLPRKAIMDKQINLLDYDTGMSRMVKLTYVGKDANGDHYQVTGNGFRVELWYDKSRLTRREMERNGKWTIIQYTGG